MDLWPRIKHVLHSDVRRIGKAASQASESGAYLSLWPGPHYLTGNRRRRDRLAVLGQLSYLLRANAPLVPGLERAAQDAPTARIASVLLSVRDDLAAGASLWESFERLSRFFPGHFVDLVKAGEDTGKLDETLSDLMELDEHRIRFWDPMQAMYAFYIPFLLLANVAVLIVLAAFVFPGLDEMAEDVGASATPFIEFATRIVNPPEGSKLAAFYAYMAPNPRVALLGMLPIVVGVPLLLYIALPRIAKSRGVVGRLFGWGMLALPLGRSVFMRANVGHIALTLQRLLAGGVPLNEALAAATEFAASPLYSDKMRRLHESVLRGNSLHEAVLRERNLPPGFADMVAVGERSGMLPEALGRAGRLYARQSLRTSKLVFDTLGPLCVAGAGFMTLFLFRQSQAPVFSIMDGLIANL